MLSQVLYKIETYLKLHCSSILLEQCQKFVAKLTVVGNFVEVYLAKRGHSGLIGLNLLEKIQAPTLASLYGAMLAGVDSILIGAGIPRSIPRVLDELAEGKATHLTMDVAGATREDDFRDHLDPCDFMPAGTRLKRPAFLAIVASTVLAKTMAKRAEGSVEGLVIEGPPAGGHNAPPRGPLQLNEQGEPIFGERDNPDLAAIREPWATVVPQSRSRTTFARAERSRIPTGANAFVTDYWEPSAWSNSATASPNPLS